MTSKQGYFEQNLIILPLSMDARTVSKKDGSTADISGVTAVIINYKTPDLTVRAVSTLRAAYPQLAILLIDNGFGETGNQLQEAVRAGQAEIRVIANPVNLHHGPAMHQAMGLVTTPWVLFVDSDCEILRSGFIELMRDALIGEPDGYAAGTLMFLDKRGFKSKPGAASTIRYIHPYCMLVNRDLYRTLPPFEKHGSPALRNMIAAAEKGYALVPIDLDPYVRHEFRGTAGRFGYGLGIRGKINRLLHLIGM